MTGMPVAAGLDTQLLIGHAVAMAIDGTALKDEAERAGGQQQGDQDRGGQRMDPVQQLLSHAQREMQESQRMIDSARGQGMNPQFQNSAREYVNTLFSLCGVPAVQGNAGEANRGGENAPKLGAQDKAAVCLINHAVKESIEASQLMQTTRLMGSASGPGEQLMHHAQEMLTDGRETLQRYLSRSGAGANRNNAGDQGQAGGRQGGSAVMTLAQRGRELVDGLQMSGRPPAGAQGAPGAPTPGIIRDRAVPPSVRENAIPGVPGALPERTVPGTPGNLRGGSSRGTTVPGGSNASESRGNTIPGGAGSGTNRGGVPGGTPGEGGTSTTPR